MTNLSPLTRKQQVLERLKEAEGGWVDGTEIETKYVGGQSGTRRLRELRAEGHTIEERRHPDTDRDIWQYRLVPPGVAYGQPKPRGHSARIVPGQTPAFFTEDPVTPDVPIRHAGTTLDPSWTHLIGTSFYDESQRIFQTMTPQPVPGAIHVLSLELAQVMMKVDFVEFLGHYGDCWRISTKRFMDHGHGIEVNGVRYLVCQESEWDLIPLSSSAD